MRRQGKPNSILKYDQKLLGHFECSQKSSKKFNKEVLNDIP